MNLRTAIPTILTERQKTSNIRSLIFTVHAHDEENHVVGRIVKTLRDTDIFSRVQVRSYKIGRTELPSYGFKITAFQDRTKFNKMSDREKNRVRSIIADIREKYPHVGVTSQF
jgi:hypothetical protein